MQHLLLALIMSQRAARREFADAAPDAAEAPAVPYAAPIRPVPRTHQARVTIARTLHRMARTVEPAGCTPAH